MKSTIIIFMILIILFSGCPKINGPNIESNVSYDVYKRYSYCGQRADHDTTFFYITNTKTNFDSLYYFIFDHNIPDTIPSSDFLIKKVISIVKYGNEFYDLNVDEIALINDIIIIKYKSNMTQENMTWVAAIPFIITTNVDFQRIWFIENGKQVKELII